MADLANASENDTDLHGDRSAAHWAERFVQRRRDRIAMDGFDIGSDEGTMLSWFAGAIETGYGLGRDDEAASLPTGS